MRYYLIAGEASGDLHGANLMAAIKQKDEAAEFRFFGGDLMQKQGGKLVKHYREMAFMGFLPVLMNIRTIFRNMQMCKQDIRTFCPDVVILIDYPGFNLKIAKFVKKSLQIPVVYYISPKVWAWKEGRVQAFKKYVDKMLCILPFEVDFFRRHQYSVTYVGNPGVDAVEQFRNQNEGDTIEHFLRDNNLTNKPMVAILAGSRKQEIRDNLPTMLQAFAPFARQYQAVVAGAPGISADFYKEFIHSDIPVVFDQTYRLLSYAQAAFVTSGTATLETALFRVPQAVCYRTPLGRVANFVFRHFFKTPYISLVNLIAAKPVVRELFGKYFTVSELNSEMNRLLHDEEYRRTMLQGYDQLIAILGKSGASLRAADEIVRLLHTPRTLSACPVTCYPQ